MKETIRILIADDHPLIRRGLRTLFSTEPGLELVGEAQDGAEAVALTGTLQPDVVLMDLVMPRMGGLEALTQIKRHCPDVNVLVLTSFSDDETVFPAIKAGALGYMLKDTHPDELVRAIRAVHRGESSLHPTIARRLIQEFNTPTSTTQMLPGSELSEREIEVLRLVARGMSNREVADSLVISERTVASHVRSILAKLHLANRTQAALYALRQGFASLDTPED